MHVAGTDAPLTYPWRLIGPHRGGRVVAVAGHPVDAMTFYFGSTGGGVWQTTNGGQSWRNISDGSFKTASVGAIAVAPSDPTVLYVGTGEACIRGNVSFGDGVYRSDDGGRHFEHLGLADTRHIGRIRIHPQNPDLVYVAALGHAFGPHPARGIYRSADGGRTWEHSLFVSENTGAVDLTLDPTNPRLLYASLFSVRREPWRLTSGGAGSGLYRSVDGGLHWSRIGPETGLPDGVWGRSGVSCSAARPGRIYALIEAREGGIYRSDDWGDHWVRGDDGTGVRARPWYYSHVFADPGSADTVYVMAGAMWRSTDGGSHFQQVATPHPDHHDLWIDPADPRRLIHGADGGAAVSFDRGASWSSLYNQPTGEFYHIAVDRQHPYRVYGSQQDNSTISVPSATEFFGITARDWFDVGGGESGHVAVRPDDPAIVYAGSSSFGEGGRITRLDRRTDLRQDVSPWPVLTRGLTGQQYRYRFQWTTPISLSPHDPKTVRVGANVVFESRDEGQHWTIISPDLTRNAEDKLGPTGGPWTPDQSGVEVYCTVFALAESPLRPGLIWAGTDDGLVQRTADGGAHWELVTPSGMPEWATVTGVEPGHQDPDVCYVAATRYRLDDPAPYIFRTEDGGRSWTAVTDGLPDDAYVRVVREDPRVPSLLYCGTERGVFASFDAGGHWTSIRGRLPVVPVHDLIVHGTDLVAATHGRALWVLDDVSGLREQASGKMPEGPWLYAPRPAERWVPPDGWYLYGREQVAGGKMGGGPPRWVSQNPGFQGGDGTPVTYAGAVMEFPTGASYVVRPGGRGDEEGPELLDAGENPPRGALFHYWLPESVEEAWIRIHDAEGHLVHEGRLSTLAGPHRYRWDLRAPGSTPRRPTKASTRIAPLVPPASYTVALWVDGVSGRTVPLQVVQDPRRQGDTDSCRQIYERIRRLGGVLSRVYAWADFWDELLDLLDRLGVMQAAGVTADLKPRLYEQVRQRADRLAGSGRGAPPGLDVQAAYAARLLEETDGSVPEALSAMADEWERELEEWAANGRRLWEETAPLLTTVMGRVRFNPPGS